MKYEHAVCVIAPIMLLRHKPAATAAPVDRTETKCLSVCLAQNDIAH